MLVPPLLLLAVVVVCRPISAIVCSHRDYYEVEEEEQENAAMSGAEVAQQNFSGTYCVSAYRVGVARSAAASELTGEAYEEKVQGVNLSTECVRQRPRCLSVALQRTRAGARGRFDVDQYVCCCADRDLCNDAGRSAAMDSSRRYDEQKKRLSALLPWILWPLAKLLNIIGRLIDSFVSVFLRDTILPLYLLDYVLWVTFVVLIASAIEFLLWWLWPLNVLTAFVWRQLHMAVRRLFYEGLRWLYNRLFAGSRLDTFMTCAVCGKRVLAFASRRQSSLYFLKQHVAGHQGFPMAYRCNLAPCAYSCARKTDMVKHVDGRRHREQHLPTAERFVMAIELAELAEAYRVQLDRSFGPEVTRYMAQLRRRKALADGQEGDG